jgi:hypothetical protein
MWGLGPLYKQSAKTYQFLMMLGGGGGGEKRERKKNKGEKVYLAQLR